MSSETKQNIGKKVILYFVFIILFTPLLFKFTQLKTTELFGAYDVTENPTLSYNSWIHGDYQEQQERYSKQNFGLAHYYIRTNNQIEFDFFNKAHAKDVVVGKNNYLFETDYIEAYYGKDFIGKEKIKNYVRKIKEIQDTLKKQNKLFLVVFALGKASYFPEHIPDNYKTKPTLSNYEYFTEQASEFKIEFIDFNKYFVSQKSISKYPLYSKFGIHWSNYAALKAFDSIVKYTEDKTKIDLPNLMMRSIRFSDTLIYPDNDGIKSMNLLYEPTTYKMAYADYYLDDNMAKKKLNALVVSDSFWRYIYGTGLPNATFESNKFWYYDEEMYPESATRSINVRESDYYSSIRNSDVIVLMHCEATLYKFSNGFVDMCYEAFCRPNLKKEKIQKRKSEIHQQKVSMKM